ncbi:hypothetical protein PUMCH_004749 [Australozyma saopauloensis]|uniref:Uncharacterized protein n=1 Tax=Australozyma saopauloensis TaxID=291208 RepID=A0AAX4HFU1_9ASCO|nr:hypothetical protein PUMCH_004749 [[Candida] saopauloensis]
MSENLKRAESLFNRIMNQNKPQATDLAPRSHLKNHSSAHPGASLNNGGGHSSNSNSSSNYHHHSNGHRHSYRSYNKYNNHNGSGSGNGNGNSNGNGAGNAHLNGSSHGNGSAVSAPQQSFDLPKRDPVAECQEAVAALEGEQHVLPYCWTIWYHSRSRKNQPATSEESSVNGSSVSLLEGGKNQAALVDSYLQAATEIEFPCFGNPSKAVKPIASLEQMWLSMSVLKRSHDLSNGSELLIFKTGVNPVWEDPVNAKGGRWVFRFNHRSNTPASAGAEASADALKGRHRATLVWERLVLKTLTGSLLPCRKELQDPLLSDIAGLVLSVRRDEEIISVWNSNSNFPKKKQDDDDKKGVFTAFHARRVYCDAILRVIREVDLIMQGSDSVDTQATLSSERVSGVTFEYRLHSDNSGSYNTNDRSRRGKSYHHHHHHREDQRAEKTVEREEI